MESIINKVVPQIWLSCSPISMAYIFVLSLIVFIVLKTHSVQEKFFLRIAGLILIVSSCFTALTVFDFWQFRNHGCQTLSPINQDWFFICFPPKDLNVPYGRVMLVDGQAGYQVSFKHKYCGKHSVAINIINNEPKPFEYNNPDRIDLMFAVDIKSSSHLTIASGEKEYDGYFLHRGTNVLEIIL